MIRALFVDDSQADLVLYRTICKHAKIEFFGIHHRTGFKQLLANPVPFDLAFVDIRLTGNTGYCVVEAMQAIPLYQHTKFAAITAHPLELERCQSAGFHGFFLKPISVGHFIAALDILLDGGSIWET